MSDVDQSNADVENVENIDEVSMETQAVESKKEEAEAAPKKTKSKSSKKASRTERQLDFSDVEEDRECPFDLDTRKKVVEALLFVSDKPIGLTQFVNAFGYDEDQDRPLVYTREVEEALESYRVELEEQERGFRLYNVSGGYQLRTAEELKPFIQNTIKARTFRLTGPTLETLAIVAYKQPITKSQVDDVRGVDSSHLMRGLMDKELLAFAGKSELPGKPMLYKTTSRFLEIFGLRNLNELPSLSEIEALIPEGIGHDEDQEEEQSLSQLTGKLSEDAEDSYSVSEEEHDKIVGELSQISTSSEFFEQEKQREREKKELEKAEGIREAIMVGEEVSDRDKRWLERFEEKMKADSEESEEAQVSEDEATTAAAEPSDLEESFKMSSEEEDTPFESEDSEGQDLAEEEDTDDPSFDIEPLKEI